VVAEPNSAFAGAFGIAGLTGFGVGTGGPSGHLGKTLGLRKIFGRYGNAKRQQRHKERDRPTTTPKLTIGPQSSFSSLWAKLENASKLGGKIGKLRCRPRPFAAFSNRRNRQTSELGKLTEQLMRSLC
jgi:hypothetical protein